MSIYGHSRRRPIWRHFAVARALAVAVMAFTIFAPTAAADGTALDLNQPDPIAVVSVDGGATWSTAGHAAPGQTVLVRLYYGAGTAGLFPVDAFIGSGLTRVGGTTRACSNPGTTDATAPSATLICNTDSGQGGPIDEALAWTGSNLSLSTTANLVNPPAAAAGFVEFAVTVPSSTAGSTSTVFTANPNLADSPANTADIIVDPTVTTPLVSPPVLGAVAAAALLVIVPVGRRRRRSRS